jgi:DNA-directed RNA polymerase specialized sigma24 family protein
MAEDIVHDVFVKFAESADRIKLTGSLKNYLVTSVVNRVRNYLRDSNRHRETNFDGTDELFEFEIPEGATVIEAK